jgi:hypothetical protein
VEIILTVLAVEGVYWLFKGLTYQENEAPLLHLDPLLEEQPEADVFPVRHVLAGLGTAVPTASVNMKTPA